MAVKTCIVSYWDTTCQYSVEVVAECLHEAAILGIKAMKISPDKLHLLSLDVAVKEPAVHRSITGAMLSAWLAPSREKQEGRRAQAAARRFIAQLVLRGSPHRTILSPIT